MGQFLAIGLATQLRIKKSEVDKAQLNRKQLQEQMKQEIYYDSEIYVASEHDDYYYFTLNDVLFQSQLLSLLHSLYPLLYTNVAEYEHILHKLHAMPPSEWVLWAKGKPEEAFQFDRYGMCDYLKADHVVMSINYESLLLSMEGKVMMETFGRQFNFLKYTMMQTFQQFSLAGALRIYITG